MKKKFVSVGLLFLFIHPVFPQKKIPDPIKLSLKDCILIALEDNLDIAVQSFGPELSDVAVSQAREIFLPKFGATYTNENRNSLTSWGVEGINYTSKDTIYNFTLQQKFITGADISLLYYNLTSETTRNLTAVNPQYYNMFRIDITQPLLKNFGPKITRYQIIRAQNQKDISVAGLNATLIQKIYEVEEGYWNLVYALENLSVRKISLDHSREQLGAIKEAARIGAKFASDVLKAEAEVANWEDQVLFARSQVEAYEDQLRKLLNLPSEGLSDAQPILPTDRPAIQKPDVTFEEALRMSLEQNPEIARLDKQIANSRLDISYFKNQILPQLDLDFSLWYPGQGGVRSFYLNNNPFSGVVVGQEVRSRADAFQDILDRTYQNWQLRLNLTLPLETIFSRGRLAQARLEEAQKSAERERLEQTITYQIIEIFKALRNNEQRIASTSRYREMVEKKLEAEEQRYRLGLVGSEWLFSYQRDLAQAKANEIKAITDYKITVAKLEAAMGTSLQRKGLTFGDY